MPDIVKQMVLYTPHKRSGQDKEVQANLHIKHTISQECSLKRY